MKSNWSQYRGFNMKIGFIVSLTAALVAFEWKSYEPISLVGLEGNLPNYFEEDPAIPIKEMQPPAAPPQVIVPEIKEVEDKVEIKPNEIVFIEDPLETPTPEPVESEPEPEPKPEETDVPFQFVEEQALPKGGMQGFYDYVRSNLEYPRAAKRLGVQGKVFLEFIVERDGSLSEVKVVRGIGAGCDEEAVRILKESPKWQPAKQRGRPVRQRMTFPINFRLQ